MADFLQQIDTDSGPREPLPVTLVSAGAEILSGAPGSDLIPIVPSDTVDLAVRARSIRCKPTTGTAGTLRFVAASGVLRNTEIGVGEVLPVAAVRIHATGTTATGLEAIT